MSAESLANPTGNIRSLQPVDIAGVGALFQKTFRNPRQAAPGSLLAYLGEIFLHHPWQSERQASKVFVDPQGAISGFIGVLPQRMLFGKTELRVSVLGSLMADDVNRNPMVGARLLRSVLTGDQDIAISESANPLSRKMWEKSGGVTLPLYSLSWTRILRPAALSVALLGERVSFASQLSPLTTPFDYLLRRIAPGLLSVAPFDGRPGEDIDVDAAEFAAAIPAFCTRYNIRPLWDQQILSWMLQHASSKRRFGSIRMRLVRAGKRIVGGYITYEKVRGMVFVLQMFADPSAEELVVNTLLARAAEGGFAAVRGRVQPEFLDALVRQQSVLFRRSSTVVHTRNADLLAALRAGDSLITGLAAEAWTKLIGDDFT